MSEIKTGPVFDMVEEWYNNCNLFDCFGDKITKPKIFESDRFNGFVDISFRHKGVYFISMGVKFGNLHDWLSKVITQEFNLTFENYSSCLRHMLMQNSPLKDPNIHAVECANNFLKFVESSKEEKDLANHVDDLHETYKNAPNIKEETI
jgi:hypothetical protein